MLTGWKKLEELDFLNEVSSVPLQQGLRHLQTAFTNFFAGRAKYPNFKKKRNGGSAEFTSSAFKFREGQVYLAKSSEPLPIRWSRQLPSGCEPSTITVKLDPSGRWFISLRIDDPTERKLKPIKKTIGIDLGISSLLTTSDGQKVANPKHFNKLYKKLRRAQKSRSRKVKGSKNREKARVQVARIQSQIADTRRDHTHKLTTQLIRENQTIVVEDLAVKNMVKNHKLARAISDANWGEIVRQLTYKAEWYGRELIKIDRWFPSSKRCSNCGHIVEKRCDPGRVSRPRERAPREVPLNIREWDCPQCGTHHDRDINASINILRMGTRVGERRKGTPTKKAAGLAVSVCGATVRPVGGACASRMQSKSVKAGAKNSLKGRRKQKPKL